MVSAPFLVASSCNQSEKDPPGDGVLLVLVQTPNLAGTPLATLSSLDATSTRVDVVYRTDCNDASTEHVTTVSSSNLSIHFVAGTSTARRLIAKLNVPAGCVEQVRFIMQSMSAVINNQIIAVKMPSAAHTGIKIVPASAEPPFPIVAGGTTTILAEYDPNKKLVLNKGQGALEKPVLEARVIPNASGEAATGFINDEVVVTFDPHASDGDIASALGFCLYFKSAHQDPRNYITLKLFSSADLYDAIACLRDKPKVVAALPNTLLALNGPNPFPGTPNDPLYQDSPPTGYDAANLQAIKAPDAWKVTTGGNVVAADIDNGFDLLHADLMYNIWINQDEIPPAVKAKIVKVDMSTPDITFVDLNAPQNDDPTICKRDNSPPNNICDPLDLADGKGTIGYGWQDGKDNDNDGYKDDFFGWDFSGKGDNLPEPSSQSKIPFHGTGVVGVMAGLGNNNVASTGVAWHARVMLLKEDAVFLTDPSLPLTELAKRDSVIRGLEYAKRKGAQIINVSVSAPIFRKDAPQDCQRGIHDVSTSKFKSGIPAFAREWQTDVASQGDGLVVVGMPDCPKLNIDTPGIWTWPAFTQPRSDAALTYTDPDMITVTGVDVTKPVPPPLGGFPIADCLPVGPDSILIEAAGTAFRILDVQPSPAGLDTATTSCPGHQDSNCPTACSGTSFAAPEVAGAGILVQANHPALSPLEVKARLLDNAATNLGAGNSVQNSRLLDVAAAVGP